MEKDFHYYCIGLLARAAGFKKRDALTLAYASQYVDDSTESEPIRVGELFFDPVRTAYSGLSAYDWSVQKRIYIPFHFIPPNPIRSPEDPFVTVPNSYFALDLLGKVWKDPVPFHRLFRAGVALHTLSDTWTHEGFSGRKHNENDVESIYHRKGKKWKPLLLKNFLLDLLPQIGHAEADYFPDQPFLVWKYTRKYTGEVIKRNNPRIFHDCAETIYGLLLDVPKPSSDPVIPWGEIKDEIADLLAYDEEDLEKRCVKWRRSFQYLFRPFLFHYSRQAWRNEALKPQKESDTEWDDFDPSEFRRLRFPLTPGFYDSPWVQFHRAALKQRHVVLENLL